MFCGFDNTVKVEWLEHDPRLMKLLETVRFKDSDGLIWTAPEGAIIDGASIPKFCWRIIGSPFVGLYRRASVIHDVYCVTKKRSWKMTHKCFHDMMLFDKVPPAKALLMYTAVYNLGPRWELEYELGGIK